MRVVFVSTRSDAIGGSNVHIRDMALALIERGHEVIVLGGQAGVFAEDVRSRGIRYVPLQFMVREIRPWTDLRGFLELRTQLSRIKPDLLSLHTAKAGVLGRLAGLGLRAPTIYTPHGWTFSEGVPKRSAMLYRAIERMLAPLATRIVNVCQADQDLAVRYKVGTPAKHITIHNGMPAVHSGLHAQPGATPVRINMIARYEEPKDHLTLFRALSGCLDLEWHLDLIGSGPLEAATRQLASELGISERVSFLGLRTDVAELLAQSQLFVLTSRWEGFPRSVLEAMRAGLPVITSRVGGVAEAVVDDVNGWIVPVGDVAALRDKLRGLIENPAVRDRMGSASRQRFEQNFTFDQMLEKYLQLYASLMRTGPEVS